MTVLLCTVGGSPDPVVKAITGLRPDRVVFFCTGRDPAMGTPGSCAENLPDIVARAKLPSEQYKAVLVPADDPDAAAAAIRAELVQCGATDRIVADYTGGTKSMSAALLLAALERPGVDLQIVTGPRANTQKVASGTEHLKPVSAARSLFMRDFPPAIAHWQRFDYAATVAALDAIGCPAPSELQTQWQRARQLSLAFAGWDRFDHAAARELLSPMLPALSTALGPYIDKLTVLTGAGERAAPARLFDLWRNAERCAARERFDDAVARWYRLVESFAQWQLSALCGFETGAVPEERIPPAISISPSPDGRRQAGLWSAWQLLAHNAPETAAAAFFKRERDELRSLLDARNGSLLAHGFAPVAAPNWERTRAFTERALLPLVTGEAKRLAHIKTEFPQLPTDYDQIEPPPASVAAAG